MRSGKLRHTITVQRATTTLDDHGTPVPSWSDLATVKAELVETSTEEFIRSYGASDETLTVFRTRYLDGVTNGDRIQFRGNSHNIKQVVVMEQDRAMELRTEKIV